MIIAWIVLRKSVQHYEKRLSAKRERLFRLASEVDNKTRAIQNMIEQINHEGVRPRVSTILGLCNLFRMQVELLRKQCPDDICINLHLDSMELYIHNISTIASDLLQQTTNAFKPYEDLQK